MGYYLSSLNRNERQISQKFLGPFKDFVGFPRFFFDWYGVSLSTAFHSLSQFVVYFS
jgi:hypothetical protein